MLIAILRFSLSIFSSGIILGVIGAIVAIGMMLIILWKFFTTIHDRREFARFEKERSMARWDAVSFLHSFFARGLTAGLGRDSYLTLSVIIFILL